MWFNRLTRPRLIKEAVMQSNNHDNRNTQLRDKDRERIEQQIQDFLARGGEIKVLESGAQLVRGSAQVADDLAMMD